MAVAAILRRPLKPATIPLILQYRPALDTICVEFPAGLLDKSESCMAAAHRELYEETGYGFGSEEKNIQTGKVKVLDGFGDDGPVIASDPVCTTCRISTCSDI